jgi:hypothetical protein
LFLARIIHQRPADGGIRPDDAALIGFENGGGLEGYSGQ